MFISNLEKIASKIVNMPDAKGVTAQVPVSPKEGWEGWVMRVFTIEPGGNTPRHIHPWPHINYIIGGEGVLFCDGSDNEIKKGGVAYVPSGIEHQFKNTGKENLEFICIVPQEGHK